MKRAKAEMHDAGRDPRTVVGRAADAGWQPVEIGAAKAHVVSPLVWPLLDMAPVLGQCCGQLVRPIFQNWRAAGSESCRHDPFGRTSVPLEAVEARRLYRQVEIGRASCRERVEISVGDGSFEK